MSGARGCYHHGDLAAAVRATALALVAERGGANFSLREVAARIGVAHPAVYAHFPSKNALLHDLAGAGLARLHARQGKARAKVAGDPLAELRAIGRAYIAFAEAEPGAYRLIFNSDFADFDAAALADARSAATTHLYDVIRAARSAGLLCDAGEEALAVTLWSAVHGLAHLLVSGHIAEMPAAAAARELTIELAIESAIAGVLSTKGRRVFAARTARATRATRAAPRSIPTRR